MLLICASVTGSAACAPAPGGGTGADGGVGGAVMGTGGHTIGTGGLNAATGGATSTGGFSVEGSGGAPGATGGAPAGTGGRASGSGGANSTGGRPGTGGSFAGTGGASASGGATGSGGSSAASLCNWPTAVGTDVLVTASKAISGTFDGGMKRFVGSGPLGTSGQLENQAPLFDLASGATLKNVILGSPAADGVHCAGSCTLINVWWEDVGEDAATLKGTSSTQVMTIDGGGANHAADKVFQHNGPGTMIIKNFCGEDFGKIYRSCGNCGNQYTRHAQFENLMLMPRSSSVAVAGMNANYNDTAVFKSVHIKAAANSLTLCQRYTGNNTGAEPPKTGAGADGTVCMYAPSDIIWQ